MKNKIGVIHGRFQGLHLGHMEYLLAGLERSEHLIIGITNNEPTTVKAVDSVNPSRTLTASNPFTYYERFCMIKESFVERGVPLSAFDIVPFPLEFPEKISNYVPLNATFYITIYDEWGKKKLLLLQEMGLKTDVMWIRTNADRLTSSTEVRDRIFNKKEWKYLVPSAVYNFVIANKLDERIRYGKK